MKENKGDVIEKILKFCTFMSFLGLICAVSFQVITRFLLPNLSQVWTEELTRFLFIFSVSFAAPLAMKKKEYVNVDILINLFPKKVREIIQLLIYAVTIGLFSIVLYFGFEFAKLGVNQSAPTMNIPMVYVYSAIPVMAMLIVGYTIYNVVQHIKEMKKRGEIS